MLNTALTKLYGIDHPIILAPMGSATSAAFCAAVSNAGGLGGIGTLSRPAEAIKDDLDAIRKMTTRPFAVNHVPPTLIDEAFEATLALRPAVVSFALGDPGDLVRRVHEEAGSLVQVQVTTLRQAVEAADHGADVIVAQGGEAGGYAGVVSTMVLVPQVVDAVAPIPVVAAGGIYDGRGLAAALLLGAAGVNLGTRFLASTESRIEGDWLKAILAAQSEDAIRADVLNDVNPLPGNGGYGTVLRSLPTPFLQEWGTKREEAARDRVRLRAEMVEANASGRRANFLATAGQSAGGIKEVLPVAEIIRRLVAEAGEALACGAKVPS